MHPIGLQAPPPFVCRRQCQRRDAFHSLIKGAGHMVRARTRPVFRPRLCMFLAATAPSVSPHHLPSVLATPAAPAARLVMAHEIKETAISSRSSGFYG